MSQLLRCDSCKGTKSILGMGGMKKPCIQCKGIGWIETDTVTPKVDVKVDNLKNANGEPVKARKRPGPKPRVQKDMFAPVE